MTKGATWIAAILLLCISVLHLYRYYEHVPVILGTFSVPDWVSLPGFAITAALSAFLFNAARKL